MRHGRRPGNSAVRQIIGKRVVEVRDEVDRAEEALPGADLACHRGSRRVGDVERCVIVVDEIPEQPILPLCEIAKPQRHRGERAVGSGHGIVDLEPQQRPDHADRMPDKQ